MKKENLMDLHCIVNGEKIILTIGKEATTKDIDDTLDFLTTMDPGPRRKPTDLFKGEDD